MAVRLRHMSVFVRALEDRIVFLLSPDAHSLANSSFTGINDSEEAQKNDMPRFHLIIRVGILSFRLCHSLGITAYFGGERP